MNEQLTVVRKRMLDAMRLVSRVAAGTALALAIGSGQVMAQTALKVPPDVEKWLPDWVQGTWKVLDNPGCFIVFYGCYESEEAYNAGIEPKYPLPLNAEARAFHDKVVKSLGEGKPIFDPDSQCYPRGLPYQARSGFKFVPGPTGDRIYLILNGAEFRTIWMDGREMPKREPHEYTYNGDSIGHWEGNTLVIETRNITGTNTAIPPNTPKSDNFWVIERWTPKSGDEMTTEITFMDEERFTEPYTESFAMKRDPNGETPPQPRACIHGEGQRYFTNEEGVFELRGPGGVPLEKAEN